MQRNHVCATIVAAVCWMLVPAAAFALHADTWGDEPEDTGYPADTWDDRDTGVPPNDTAGEQCEAPEVLNPQFRVEPEALPCLQIQKYLEGRQDNIWQFRATNNCRNFSIRTREQIFTVGRELRPGVTAGIQVPGYRYDSVAESPGWYTRIYEFEADDKRYDLEYTYRVPTAEERKQWKSINCGPYRPPDQRDTSLPPDTEPPPPDTGEPQPPDTGTPECPVDSGCDPYLPDTGNPEPEWNTEGSSESARGYGCGCSSGGDELPAGNLAFGALLLVGCAVWRRRVQRANAS